MKSTLKKSFLYFSLALLGLSSIAVAPGTAEAKSYLKPQSNGVIKVTTPKMKKGTQMYLVLEKGKQSYSYRLPKSQQITVPFGSGTYQAYLYTGNGKSFRYIEERKWKASVSALGLARQRTLLVPGKSEYHVSYLMNKHFKGWQKWSQAKRVQRVHQYITTQYHYDYDLESNTPDWYQPDYQRLSKYKKGICYDFASLNASLLREMGIPTRLVMGYPTNNSSYHAWNEVYINKKWRIVDVTYDLGSKTRSPYKSNTIYKKVSYRM